MGGKRFDAETKTEYRAPARSAQVGSDVLVPLLQSGVTGILVGVVFWNPKAGVLAFFIAWLLLLFDHRRLLWRIERVIGRDITADGKVGHPDRPPIVIDGRKVQRLYAQRDADEKREAWITFIKIVAEREQQQRKTGQRALRGWALTPNYSVTDEFHAQVGQALIDAGFAKRDLDGGWSLSAPLDDVLAALDVWQL
jgi:hypothetical protein